MFLDNHLSRKVNYREADISTQTRCRDQRKMRQVAGQIKTLADNLDELRTEVTAFKDNYLGKDAPPEDCRNGTKNSNTSMFQKLKKYIRKIRSIDLLKSGRVFASSQKVCYPGTDPPASSFLSYSFRFGKPGHVSRVPAEIKYSKDECSQTDGETQQSVASSTAETPLASKHVESILRRETPPTKRASKRYEFQEKRATLFPPSSRINRELYSPVENPSDFKGSPRRVEVRLLNDKQRSSAFTQTKATRMKRKRGSLDFQSKHPTVYLSRIKNAVITKKIIRNPYESSFSVSDKVKGVEDYPYLKSRFYGEFNKKRGNDVVETVAREITEEKYALEDRVQRLKIVSSTNQDVVCDHSPSEEEMGLSSTPVSLDLELNVSDRSVIKIEDSPRRRKPRTYTISKSARKRNQTRWFDHDEESVVYVGTTSELTLSSDSFRN
ncbi:uncharacterized protein LOC143372662 [Andrena cerasifolii]|uniref:uncharacterized protein LOC143372662 n=1 Tax=Andrena cerasifolii TaxID=2819439 RepID=UPI0040382404